MTRMKGLLSTLPEGPEFRLLLELTHPSANIDQSKIISEIMSPQFDDKKFLDLVEWHRVMPQVYHQLKEAKNGLPDDFFGHLKAMNSRCRMTSLSMSSWLARISRRLDTQNITFISLKGIGLSKHLYGEDGYRECRDIDILVAPEDVNSTERILFELGFVRIKPYAEATTKQLHYFNRHKKDREYFHPEDGILLELHWRLIEVDHPFNPSLSELMATGSSISVHGEKIASMSGVHLWLYQCLHGSLAGWYRMRWICDIALLLCFHQPDWEHLLELADQYQCRNSLAEAVGLACALYELPVPELVHPSIQRSRSVQRNIERSANRLFNMLMICGDLIAYARRIAFCAPASSLLKYLLGRCLISTGDFERVQLPDKFFFAYYLIRPFSFLLRRMILKNSAAENKPH